MSARCALTVKLMYMYILHNYVFQVLIGTFVITGCLACPKHSDCVEQCRIHCDATLERAVSSLFFLRPSTLSEHLEQNTGC